MYHDTDEFYVFLSSAQFRNITVLPLSQVHRDGECKG